MCFNIEYSCHTIANIIHGRRLSLQLMTNWSLTCNYSNACLVCLVPCGLYVRVLDGYVYNPWLFWPAKVIYLLTCFDVFNLYSPSFDLFDVLDVIYNLYFNPVCLCLNLVISNGPTKQFAPIRRLMVHFLCLTAGALSVLPVQCRNWFHNDASYSKDPIRSRMHWFCLAEAVQAPSTCLSSRACDQAA